MRETNYGNIGTGKFAAYCLLFPAPKTGFADLRPEFNDFDVNSKKFPAPFPANGKFHFCATVSVATYALATLI
jgi:hypothetical protein